MSDTLIYYVPAAAGVAVGIVFDRPGLGLLVIGGVAVLMSLLHALLVDG